MKIKHGRSREWERAAMRGETALLKRIYQEVNRLRKRRLDRRSRGLNRSIPLAERKKLQAASRARREARGEV